MGAYADNLKRRKAESVLNDLLNKETNNGKIESLKEALNLLSSISDGATKLEAVISSAISAACSNNGAIANAIAAAITGAIGENGSIETWADGRYEAKSV